MSRSSEELVQIFESWFNDQHLLAGQMGILPYVEKHSSSYIGCLEGQYLVVEVKSVESERLLRSRISKSQQQHLDVVGRAAGLALLAVQFHTPLKGTRRYVVPWLEIPWRGVRTAESVLEKDIQKWKVVEPCYLSRWHSGGSRSSDYPVSVEARQKHVLPRE